MSNPRKRAYDDSDSCPIVESQSQFDTMIEENSSELKVVMEPGLNEMETSCPKPPSVGGKSRKKRLNRRKKKLEQVI